MAKRGRPRLIGLNSNLFQKFYFDPYFSPDEIMSLLNISKQTYYRLERELQAPKLKVGMGTYSDLPQQKMKWALKGGVHHYDYELMRLVCRRLKIRAKVHFDSPKQIVAMTSARQLDVSFASISKTTRISEQFSVSKGYQETVPPQGQVYLSTLAKVSAGQTKPKIGVIKNNVHHLWAIKNLNREYEIVPLASAADMSWQLKIDKIAGLLIFPEHRFLYDSTALIPHSRVFCYGGSTVALFSKNSEKWQQPFNEGIEQVKNNNEIDESLFFKK